MASPTQIETAVVILVVDDRPDNIIAIEAVLSDSRDYSVMSATSGAEAVELVKQVDFALILLDIQMPGMDGYQTAQAIKALPQGKDVPIIMVTAIYKEDPHILRGYQAGAVDYVGKPFNPDILKAKVGVYTNIFIKSRQIAAQGHYLLEAEVELDEQRESRTNFDAMPVGVMITNKVGKITRFNKEAVRIWGGTRLVGIDRYSDFVGTWAGTGKPVLPEEWALARAIRKGETSQFEIIAIQTFDGKKKTILNSAAPIHDRKGDIAGAVAIIQDITHQQELEAALPPFVRS